jgi:hypothetical protein
LSPNTDNDWAISTLRRRALFGDPGLKSIIENKVFTTENRHLERWANDIDNENSIIDWAESFKCKHG